MKNSPLAAQHLALGAKMADFGGWLMPIEYSGSGVLSEHAAVRERVGLFDVSHLGKASVKGEGALDFLNSVFTNDLRKISDSKAQYTMLCTTNGGVVDDLIVYRNSERDFFLIPNAANTSSVVEVLKGLAPEGVEVENLHDRYGVIALQGPLASEVLLALGIDVEMNYMTFSHGQIAGYDVIICRTGYTGERGYEVIPLWNETEMVWKALASEVLSRNGAICGLGARDTLRTEMGYPLHGHELALDISPVQADAMWAVGWSKEKFIGSQALIHEKTLGPDRILRGLISTDKGIPRAGMQVKTSEGAPTGEITSGTFSPTKKVGIALALISPKIPVGESVIIDVRGRECVAQVVSLPFVPSHVR